MLDTGEKVGRDDFESMIGCLGAFDVTFAYTWNPLPQLPSQTQIRPWFFQWVRGQTQGQWRHVGIKARVFDWLLPKVTKGWPFTPMDAASLLDTTMLHEMAHTRAGHYAVDVCRLPGNVYYDHLTPVLGCIARTSRCRLRLASMQRVGQEGVGYA